MARSVATEDADGGPADAVRELASQVLAGDPADAVGSEEPPHLVRLPNRSRATAA
jgi:hypothetical protein